MKKIALFAVVAAMAFATISGAQAPERIYELPKFAQPPTLDGDRFTVPDEWAGTLELPCSPSQVLADGAEYGWREIESQSSEVSTNQLVQSPDEDASVARTDEDFSSTIWHAWDDDAFYYIAEVRDNARDVEGGETTTNWWERDSMSLYVDLNNEGIGGDVTADYVNLNIVNFVAAPMNSSSVTRTLEVTVQQVRQPTQDADDLEGMEYGFRDAGDEFGGEADYVIEGMMTWEAFQRTGNLYALPSVGTIMGISWIGLDPDGDEAYGGQIQCVAWATDAAGFADLLFTDTPAGPQGGTAVQNDSWGRVKATFAE
jgi:hypothetical protein